MPKTNNKGLENIYTSFPVLNNSSETLFKSVIPESPLYLNVFNFLNTGLNLKTQQQL